MNATSNTVSEQGFPSVAFKIHDEDYCIASNVVEQMIIQTGLSPIPKNPPYMSGIINVRGIIYPVIDLRILFNLENLSSEINSFMKMREGHLNWVKALKKTILDKTPFMLPHDPHLCQFGNWYYNYHTHDVNLNILLEKIEEPHTKLHEQADVVESCLSNNNEEGANEAFLVAEDLCNNTILPLINQIIDAYKNLNRGMIILVEQGDSNIGLAVDTVTSIEHFEGCEIDNSSLQFAHNKYIKNVIVPPDDRLFLELDLDAIFDLQNEFVLD